MTLNRNHWRETVVIMAGLALCSGITSVTFADDTPPAQTADADKTAGEKPAKEAEAADKPGQKDGINIQKSLEGLGVKAPNPLEAIIEKMREAQGKLQKTETDQQTRELQTKIVQDIDKLLEQLKNQKPPPSGSPPPDQPPPPMNNDNQNQPPPRGGSGQPKPQNSQQQSQPQSQQKGGSQQNNKQSEAQTKSDKSRQSSQDQRAGQKRSAEEEAARQRIAKDVWGHLPPALRQELLNVYSEKFLPKYDEMVRKYYEALAEQNRKNQ